MEENKDLEQESSSTPQPMTKADEIKQTWLSPDFTPTKVMTDKDLLSTSVMQMSDAEREDLLRSTGVYASTGQQVSTAIENALTGMNQLGDELMISFGNVSNYITGGAMGKELQDIAYDSMARRYEYMAMNEDAVGGIRSELAQLAGGATSFLQLALEGLATGGYLSLAHIGAQSFGEGTYNDMKAYADKHDGSLEGYKPQGVDLAINTANAIMQVATEEILGVGRVGFIKSAALRGGIKEGLGGFVQEAAQGALADLAEAMKGNEEYGILLDNIDQYVRDGIIGGVLQGPLGAASYHHYHAKATNTLSGAIAKARGHETPTAEDQQQAEDIISANERGYASAFVKEFKAAFDASTGEGQLQANIAKAINDAIKAKELDLGIDDETKRAQKVEQIATQETLNAMEQANEQNKSISEMGINNIVYKDGAIWVEGMTPELGERAVEYARVLAERQTGLAEVQTKLDATNREIAQIKKDLAEAKVQSKEAFAKKLQARLEKQTKLAEKRKIQAEQLKAQTDKIEAQIAKQLKEAPKTVVEPKMEVKSPTENVQKPVETRQENVQKPAEQPKPAEEPKPLAKVAEKLQKPKGEKKSLSAERGKKSKTKAKAKKKMTLKELKAALKEHFKKVYNGVSDDFIERYVDEAIEDVELTRNKNTALKILAEHFDELYDPNDNTKVNWEWLQEYDGDIKGDSFTALYMYETGDITVNEDSDADVWEVVDEFTSAVHDVPITTKEQAMEWVKNHQYQSTIAKLGLDEDAVDNDVFEFEGSEYDLSQITREDLNEYEQEKVKDHISKEEKKKHLTREDVINNLTENNDRFLKIVIPVEGKSFIEANKETLDKINIFAKADFLQRALVNDKITPAMIDEIFDFIKSMPQDTYLSNVYYDIAVKPTTNVETAVKAKEEYDKIFTPKSEQLIEDWAGKTPSEVGNEGLGKIYTVYNSEIKPYMKDGVITDKSAEENQDDLREVGKTLFSQELLDYMFLKYDFDPRVQAWVKENPDLMHNNDEQKDAWEYYSESDLVDILGEDMDFPPENLIQYDENTKYDEDGNAIYDYEQSVYKMPSTQEEFEAKIAEAMIKQTKNALEIEDSDIDAYEVRKNETPYLFQNKVEGTGSDKYRGAYDERLKRIVLSDKSDLTTIQHEFAHYWLQNNFKWARSGLASPEWLRKWRDVEEALGIEPQDRFLSKQASEKFARAYERFIMEGKYNDDLKWAFDGFKEFYDETYEDLKNEYFDLSEELDPAIVDWFNRQRPTTEKALKEQAYKKVATVAMAQGADVITPVNNNTYAVSSMNENGEVTTDLVVTDTEAQDSKLAQFSDKKKKRRVIEGLRESNKEIAPDKYNVLNRAATVEEAKAWVASDYAGAWAALNSDSTNLIDRSALFQAFKELAENGNYQLGKDLAAIKFPKQMTEIGQAVSVLGERSEFDPLTILENAQKALGEPSAEDIASETADMGLDVELTEDQVKELKETTECVL